MTRTDAGDREFVIDSGPSKLDLMLSLFDNDMGERTVGFRVGSNPTIGPKGKTRWAEVRISRAQRVLTNNTSIWELSGFTTDERGEIKQVSIYYLSDRREGMMRFEDGLRTHGIMETPDDARRARALMVIIQKMVAIAQNHGGLPEDFYVLFEKAKPVSWANDHKSLADAINQI
jgi:hypothetical protein